MLITGLLTLHHSFSPMPCRVSRMSSHPHAGFGVSLRCPLLAAAAPQPRVLRHRKVFIDGAAVRDEAEAELQETCQSTVRR